MPPGPEWRLPAQRADLLSTPLITVGGGKRLITLHQGYCPFRLLQITGAVSAFIPHPLIFEVSRSKRREQNFLTEAFTCGHQSLANKPHFRSLECCSKASFQRRGGVLLLNLW